VVCAISVVLLDLVGQQGSIMWISRKIPETIYWSEDIVNVGNVVCIEFARDPNYCC
jgi:hypothetical protein